MGDKYKTNYLLDEALNHKLLIKENVSTNTGFVDLDYYQKYYQYYIENGMGLNGMIEGPIPMADVQIIANILVSPYNIPSNVKFDSLSLSPKQLALVKCALTIRN